jgi:AcrR family transcriptional regulator
MNSRPLAPFCSDRYSNARRCTLSSAVEPRRKNARGDASRERILDAAAEVAGERGYEGTSISLVSQRSGLPASSIYWHFKDKDELIAAVIDRSFHGWVASLEPRFEAPPDAAPDEAFRENFLQNAKALAAFPDFLRLGLMLILERRPREATARKKFMEGRRITEDRLYRFYVRFFAHLADSDVRALAQLTLAMADGYFIAREAEDIDLASAFDVMACAILGAADRFAQRDAARS